MSRYSNNIYILRERLRRVPGWIRTATTESQRGFSVHVDTKGYGWTGRGSTEGEALAQAVAETPLVLIISRAEEVSDRYGDIRLYKEDVDNVPFPKEELLTFTDDVEELPDGYEK